MKIKGKKDFIPVQKADLVLAWSLLENMTVSLDQMCGTYDYVDKDGNIIDEIEYQALCKSLHDYFISDLWQQLNQARMRLKDYLPDEEVEYLSENEIPYWDYKEVNQKPSCGEVEAPESPRTRKPARETE
ncbi:hypothetical protein HYR99_02590 [Candidatus Poribacteria bacterium]|nr:hypothetical protein [Candidatus Poribacteria bacterium]